MMTQSVDGLINNAADLLRSKSKSHGGYYGAGLEQLGRNLRELRDRFRAGDVRVVDEFFAFYVFEDDTATKVES